MHSEVLEIFRYFVFFINSQNFYFIITLILPMLLLFVFFCFEFIIIFVLFISVFRTPSHSERYFCIVRDGDE